MFYKIVRFVLLVLSNIVFRFKHINTKNLPETGAVIVCCNHVKLLDVVFVAISLKRNIRFMAKKELTSNGIMRWLFKMLKVIPVDRQSNDVKALKTSLKTLKNGEVLGIFPEGTRTDEQREVTAGIAMMAYKTGASILPAYIDYKSKLKIRLTFKDLIPHTELGIENGTQEEYKRISNEIMDSIYNTGKE